MSNKPLVKDYMTKEVITVPPETPNEDIIKLMKESGHDGFPVTHWLAASKLPGATGDKTIPII